jgi:uncharacterized protein (DUF488 family)
MIYTSCFKLSGHHPNAIAISNGTRFYSHVRKYRPLVPPWQLVKESRDGRLSAAEFEAAYQTQLQALDAEKVVAEVGENAILLCWEAPGEYCHRRMVAAWLETELGIQVPELVI